MRLAVAAAVAASAAALVGNAVASAPPVGPLPAGPTSTIATTKGELVSIALPHRTGGKVWRIAQNANPKVLKQVTEGDVGPSVVLVFKAVGSGTTTIKLGLTVGEKTKAYESRTYVVRVR